MFLRRLVVLRPSVDVQINFCGNRPREPPTSGELKTRPEYIDFGPIERYISESETVQDMELKLVLITNELSIGTKLDDLGLT